ncbi:ribonuclease P protein component 4 [Methanofollis fontis]|uniref:Ribonuclease P protein component 4 n=1 Tax=Methanofollis fontis TaxID=2052832 RepID=A0A483CUA0_9EURY|nr:ribonuclease P protein component 4 [Methanofollis fontis]TAJ45043.1 ribonuclease P [Methanofollis fontis]
MRRKSRTDASRQIAGERVERLFACAEEISAVDPDRASRYVGYARRIAMRQRVRIPRLLARRFCRRCSAYLVPGRTARIRISRGKVIVTCLVCGYQRRYPVVKKHQDE